MRCPACKEPFGKELDWAWRVSCPGCGTRLRVSRRTVVAWFLVGVLGIPLVAVGACDALDALDIPTGPLKDAIFFCLALVYLFGASYLVWKTGSYTVEGVKQGEANNLPPGSVDNSGWEPFTHLVGVLAFLTWVGLVVAVGYRDLLLTFGSRLATGRVVSTEWLPSDTREVAYDVQYEFKDEAGTVCQGTDRLPLEERVVANGRIEILYCPWAPSVSRIASEFTLTCWGPPPARGAGANLGDRAVCARLPPHDSSRRADSPKRHRRIIVRRCGAQRSASGLRSAVRAKRLLVIPPLKHLTFLPLARSRSFRRRQPRL